MLTRVDPQSVLNITEDDLIIEPEIDGAPPPRPEPLMQRAGVGNSVLATLNVVSLALCIVLLVALYFVSQSIRQVTALEERLDHLTQFEKRITDQIDTVNTGFHRRMDDFARDMSGLEKESNEMQMGVDALARRSQDLAGRIEDLGEPARLSASGVDAPSPAEPAKRVVLSAPAAQAPAVETPGAPVPQARPPQSSVKYERKVGADGKVTYSIR